MWGETVKKLISVIILLFMLCGLTLTASAEDVAVDKNQILSSLYEADISTLRQAIEIKLISCEELTAYYLERIEQYNDNYNCFITLCDDAIEVARSRDAAMAEGQSSGLLFGIPVVVKDNIDVEGIVTTNGRKKSASAVAKGNAAVVDYLLKQGAVIIGKTNMSTDAQDARVSYSEAVGETKNAYNTLLASGGSSGGTAVGVSLNFAAAGLGTDTNSSLRIPAVINGCVALRPTFKLIDRNGCVTLNSTRDVVGPITRTVYDQAVMMDVLTDGQYSYTDNLDKNAIKGLRIGVLNELSYAKKASEFKYSSSAVANKFDLYSRGENNVDSEISAAFQNAVNELESCGAEVIDVSMPDVWNLSYKTFANSNSQLKLSFYGEFEKLLAENEIDAVIFPTYLSAPLKSGKDENGKYWNANSQVFLNNCRVLSPSASIPELSMPIGYHSSGAGIGMEIASLKNNEQLLLNIAYSYTQRFDHRAAPADAPDLYAEYYSGSLKGIIDSITNTDKEDENSDDAVDTDVKLPVSGVNYGLVINVATATVCGLCLVAVIVLIIVAIKKRRG